VLESPVIVRIPSPFQKTKSVTELFIVSVPVSSTSSVPLYDELLTRFILVSLESKAGSISTITSPTDAESMIINEPSEILPAVIA